MSFAFFRLNDKIVRRRYSKYKGLIGIPIYLDVGKASDINK